MKSCEFILKKKIIIIIREREGIIHVSYIFRIHCPHYNKEVNYFFKMRFATFLFEKGHLLQRCGYNCK